MVRPSGEALNRDVPPNSSARLLQQPRNVASRRVAAAGSKVRNATRSAFQNFVPHRGNDAGPIHGQVLTTLIHQGNPQFKSPSRLALPLHGPATVESDGVVVNRERCRRRLSGSNGWIWGSVCGRFSTMKLDRSHTVTCRARPDSEASMFTGFFTGWLLPLVCWIFFRSHHRRGYPSCCITDSGR